MSLLRHVACLLLGAVVSLAAIAEHRSRLPFGLLLGLAVSFGVAGWLLTGRRPRTTATYAAGWLAMLAAVASGRPEGDFVLANDPAGFAVLGSGLVMVLLGLVSFPVARGSAT